MAYPNDLKYTREHEWVKLDGKTATVGITHYAPEQLGDIVFVELPNSDAHGSWMIRIETKDPAESNGLLSAADYEKFIAEEQGK